ncbi:MAG: 23S rRNA (uracil(1939)-C(5))-methyltransferase RlmD [Eggerthellaceae bacterium]|nr:23S rRNA (uracil(1939)-C(5))-methyltransferase RlmD [Eggerthellaceae bacterium]
MNHIVEVERMAYSADAIGHLSEGKTVFIEGGVPGDTVEVVLTEEKPSFARGKVVRVVEASPDRIPPESPVDYACGTAPWQCMRYEAQLSAKRENVVGALVHTAHLEVPLAEELVRACEPSKRTWGYRNKLEMATGVDAAGRFELGFYREGTHEFASADSSHLAHKQIEKAPKALRGAIRYAQGNQELGIFRVGVRHSLVTGELEVALWTKPGSFPRGLFAKTLSTAVKATSVVRVLADPGKARKVKGVEILDGRGYWRERIGDVQFSTQAPSFFQVNTAQAGKLVNYVLEGLGELDGAYVADLYAGGGTFSVPLALAGADVVAVESAKSSVRDLRFNANSNGVDIDVVGGDAAHELALIEELDALVVDPPRAGLADGVVEDIASTNAAVVAYVSCDPATWARDVMRFESNGYRLRSAQPVDMFPQTYHVEIVSFFDRA